MFKRILTVFVVTLLVNLILTVSVPANAQTQKKAGWIEEVKAKIAKLGTGSKARVRITLSNNKKVEGYIGSVADDHFVLTNDKTGASTDIAYSEVAQVKSLKPPKALIVGVVLAAVAGAVLLGALIGLSTKNR